MRHFSSSQLCLKSATGKIAMMHFQLLDLVKIRSAFPKKVKVVLQITAPAIIFLLCFAEYRRANGRLPLVKISQISNFSMMKLVQIDENATQRREISSPRPHVLLLSSSGRSGSSFLGQILSSVPGTIYFYEPFNELEKMNNVSQDIVLENLKNLFTCNITTFTQKLLSRWDSKGISLSGGIYPCKKEKCFQGGYLGGLCQEQKTRLVKTIRTRVGWVHSLLEDKSMDLIVVHLLRDPRASLISGWKIGWQFKASQNCKNLLDDLQEGLRLSQKYPNRYFVVKYEDLCAHPVETTHQTLKLIGHDAIPEETQRFVESHTTNGSDFKAYGLYRNSEERIQKWREIITEDQLDAIQSSCKEAILAIGHRVFGDIAEAQSLSVPLINDNPEYNILL